VIQSRVESFDRTRRDVLRDVAAMSTDDIEWRPAPDAWHVREVVEHLVLTEQVVLRGFPEFDQLVERRRTVVNRFWHAVIRVILQLNIPVRNRSRGMQPSGGRSLAELIPIWDAQHAWLKRYAEHIDRAGRDPAVFKHPIAGPLTLRQGLRLASKHLGRHWDQIRRSKQLERRADTVR